MWRDFKIIHAVKDTNWYLVWICPGTGWCLRESPYRWSLSQVASCRWTDGGGFEGWTSHLDLCEAHWCCAPTAWNYPEAKWCWWMRDWSQRPGIPVHLVPGAGGLKAGCGSLRLGKAGGNTDFTSYAGRVPLTNWSLGAVTNTINLQFPTHQTRRSLCFLTVSQTTHAWPHRNMQMPCSLF